LRGEPPVTGVERIAIGLASFQPVLFRGGQRTGAPLARCLVRIGNDLGQRCVGIAKQNLLFVEWRLLGGGRIAAALLVGPCRQADPSC
jgi:hypothetical protein